jgi:hypothetical protein
MHSKISAVVLLAVAAAVTGANAEDAPPDAPKGYTCTFTAGTAWTFDNGTFKSKTPEPLTLSIANIDLDRQTAQLVPEPGKPPGALKVVRAINANHFLEVVNEGFLNLTTIYDMDTASGTYPAVHSRHFGVLGQPVVGQYAGTCTAK